MEIGVVGLIGVRGIAVCYPKIPDVVNKQKRGKDIAIIRLHNMVDLIAMVMELRFIQKHAHWKVKLSLYNITYYWLYKGYMLLNSVFFFTCQYLVLYTSIYICRKWKHYEFVCIYSSSIPAVIAWDYTSNICLIWY